MNKILRAPFPYFGNKAKIAPKIWRYLNSDGRVKIYAEPFCGALAMLLSNPSPIAYEVVNDLDGYLINFWRAVKHDPQGVIDWADDIVGEVGLIAKYRWLKANPPNLELMRNDFAYFDAKIAGIWLWAISCWIGGGFLSVDVPSQKLPAITKGIHAAGRRSEYPKIIKDLSQRLRYVNLVCGDWERCLGGYLTESQFYGRIAVFLDPPYVTTTDQDLYTTGNTPIGYAVAEWAKEHGGEYRIAMCGYEGEYDFPADWRILKWTGGRGYSTGENTNRFKECVWLSPACPVLQGRLL